MLTKPTSAPKSNKTLASESPKVASIVTEYVVLSGVISIVSVMALKWALLKPIPAIIALFLSDQASNVSVYEFPLIISTFWLTLTLDASPASKTFSE